MVVTATKLETSPNDLPFSVTEIGQRDFEIKLPRTTPDALREQPSVMLQKTAHGQGSPFIRGFTGFRTVMLIDGIRLNNSTFRDGPNQYWNTVDNYSIDHLELVRGPGSVLYGSDAIGGTVNAFTIGRQDFSSESDADGRTLYRYSTAERSHIGRAEVNGNLKEHIGLSLGGTIKSFGDLEGGRDVGRQLQTGYDEWDVDAKLEYRLNDQAKIVVAHQTVVQDDAWRTHATIYGILWEGTTRGNDLKRALDQNRHLSYLQYHAEDLDGVVNEIHASLSHHLQGEEQDRIRNTSAREVTGYDVNTLGASLQFVSQYAVGTWVYGAEYYRDWVDSFGLRYASNGTLAGVDIQGPVGDEATYDSLGFYVENRLPLFDERLEIISGGRYSYFSADADKVRDPVTGTQTSISDSWDTLVGSGRMIWHVDEARHWNIFGGVSQGFRAPNLSDLSRFDIALSGELETASPNLKPERFVSYEGGLKAVFNRFTFETAYFYTSIDDLIVRTLTGNTVNGLAEVTKLNSGEGYVQGVELAGSFRLHRDVLLWANYTWMEGSLDTPVTVGGPLQREPVSRLMPQTVNVGLRWEHPARRFYVELAATVAERQDRLSSSDRRDTQRIPPAGTPGYAVGHLRGGWKPCESFRLSVAVENLTDEDYRIHGSGLNEPGRNFVLTAELRF